MLSKALYKIRDIKDLKNMIEQSERHFGMKNAFWVKNREGSYLGITYSQCKSDMDALGTALIGLGLKGKFIAVIGENRYEWCLTYLTTVNGVGVIVPLDKELPLPEIEDLLRRSGAAAVVFSKKFQIQMQQISRSCDTIEYFIGMDMEGDEEGFLSFKKLVENGREQIRQGVGSYQKAVIDPEAMCALLYTSGTTGTSKGVMLSHKNLCSNITSVCKTVKVKPEDSSVSILPLHHTYECTLGFLLLLYGGATISFNEGLKHIAKNMKEVAPTLLFSVPLILENMHKKICEQMAKKRFTVVKFRLGLFLSNVLYKGFRLDVRRKLFRQIYDNIGGRLRLVMTGAAAIDPKVSKWFRNIGIKVLQGYGLTECSPLVAGNRDHAFIDRAAGMPIPGVEVRIDNPNENGIGEIVVKGDNVMLGYYQDEATTRSCIKDGWFHTGDLGYIDKKGFLYLTGRAKNVIVTKNGKKVFPEELETCINRSPFIKESLVWGKYDKASGETFVSVEVFPDLEAIKEKLKNVSISKDELMHIIGNVIKSINKDMPIYKRIRNFSIRDSEFIKTTTQKIKRHAAMLSEIPDA